MNQNFEPKEIVDLNRKCETLLQENDVRFVGIVNYMGKQIAGRYKNGITPLVDEEEHKMSVEHTLEVLLTKDLDKPLGAIDYIITKRKKVFMITIPAEKHSILISAEQNTDAEKIVEKAMKLFG